MPVLLFHRVRGEGYIVESSHIEPTLAALERAHGEDFVRGIETLDVPLGGALRVRALGDGHLDVTTSLVERLL